MKDLMSAMHKIIYIAKTHHSVIECKMKDIDMHRSMHVMLSYIKKCSSPPSQKDIARDLKISPAAVAATVDRLESDGYIEKLPLDTDRRANMIKISKKGADALAATCEIFSSTDEETFRGLSEEELGSLCEYLDRISKNLTEMKGGGADGDEK